MQVQGGAVKSMVLVQLPHMHHCRSQCSVPGKSANRLSCLEKVSAQVLATHTYIQL